MSDLLLAAFTMFVVYLFASEARAIHKMRRRARQREALRRYCELIGRQ